MAAEQVLVARVADRLWEARDSLIAGIMQMTRDQISVLQHDAAARSLLEASITENVVAGLNFLRQGIDVAYVEAPTAALAYARILAQRDVSLSALLRAYRMGHSQVLDLAFTVLDDLPAEQRVPALVAVVQRSAEFIDQVTEQVGRAYELERDRWVASRSGVRQQWVNELLGGGPADRGAAERALRYPLDAVHLACVLWPAGRMTSFDLVPAVEEARAHLVSVLRARAFLVVPTDEREARLWLALPEGADVTLGALAPPAETPLHVAIGRPGTDLAGFRASARQAARVKEITVMRLGQSELKGATARRPVEPQWVRYDDIAPVALMAGDVEAVRDFTATALGDLAEISTRNAMLRETLRAFLTHHRSHAATAEAMNLHRNSIQYRVQQATELLPGGARSLEDDFNVRAALLAAHWLGEWALA
ncbi:helix-turn-helix domain-containing protein [Streptomyces sp. SS7]|uniref:PucR family transcriptional regulator n=1 Tax=Streptomyces sp. SS7 TaxID=3108485 RepID=UPI0030ED83DF